VCEARDQDVSVSPLREIIALGSVFGPIRRAWILSGKDRQAMARPQLLASLPSSSFPGVAMLIVVHAGEIAFYEHLERTFEGVRGVKVIMDRRRGDRRRGRRDVDLERRECERRLRSGRRFALGYTAVRFRE
jgi:hypothetical protein